MKDTVLSQLLYGVCLVALGALSVILLGLPWFVPILIECSTIYTEAHQMTLLILLYVTGIPAWLIVWATRGLAMNIIGLSPFLETSVKAVKKISLAALFICGSYTVALGILPISLSLFIIIVGSFMVALIGAILYKLIQQAMRLQEENELTI